MTANFISHISECAGRYDAFIVDLWGVIHDGTSLYPNAAEALEAMFRARKKVIFLSNAPRRSSKIEQLLTQLGIDRRHYLLGLSSGEVFYRYAEKKTLGAAYLYIGPEKDRDLLLGLPYQESTAENAAFAVATGFDGDDSTLAEVQDKLDQALQHRLPLYCINPDKIVVRQDGTSAPCAGLIAEAYQRMGGEAIYFGKPHRNVYEACLAHFDHPDMRRVCAIGDGPETDIKGAAAMGIDSILISGGILAQETGGDPQKALEICQTFAVTPTYIAPKLVW